VLFDRSWYNRGGVERVMKFCSKQEYVRIPVQIEHSFQLKLNTDSGRN